MNADQKSIDQQLKLLLEKGKLEINEKDFENKVMKKVEYAHAFKEQQRKNIRMSWFFLVLSALFFPLGIISFFQKMNWTFSDLLGRNLHNVQHFIIPALVLIFSILLLLQIDNLFRLTTRTRYS
jgi:heme/copper-type cytochrome/quinol oxidase subunit 3